MTLSVGTGNGVNNSSFDTVHLHCCLGFRIIVTSVLHLCMLYHILLILPSYLPSSFPVYSCSYSDGDYTETGVGSF
jgi:hypothetical protein